MGVIHRVALYVEKHPKAKAEEIAKAIGEPVGRVASSLKAMTPKKKAKS